MEWKKQSERTVQAGYKRVTLKTFKMPDGEVAEYSTWGNASDSTAVIALTPDMKVVIARQFRSGPEVVFDELPGGGVEEGESPEEAAVRELCEETGYVPDKIEKIGIAYHDAYTNETHHYFIAHGCTLQHNQQLDDGEHVEVALIDIDALIHNAKHARMSDATAVLMAYDELMLLRG